MKNINIILVIVPSLFACSQTPDYNFSASTSHIKEIQILDIHASEANDGVTAQLNGSYGEVVMKYYTRSSYDAKSAREVTQAEE